MDLELQAIIEGVSNTQGDDFFQSITDQLAKVIKANYTFIARLDVEQHMSRTISMSVNGQAASNMEYSLKGTPCANVAEDSVCCFPRNVVSYFPDDQLLIDMGIEAYLGTPLHDSKGRVFGLIVALYEDPIESQERALTLFQIFSGRISAEMERRDYETQLEDLNAQLEEKVFARTSELSQTLDRLNATQEQLIEAEKNAALGSLVSGIAHEVNTPLGVAITAQSVMEDGFNTLCKKIDNDELTIQDMDAYRKEVAESLFLQGSNLHRARLLIDNFKKTAADQHSLELDRVDLADYYRQVLTTLKPLLKQKKVRVDVTNSTELLIDTYPGIHAQILTNLVSNSVKHAFDEGSNNTISIRVSPREDGGVEVSYHDNGKGLNAEQAKNIFNPFYTTARKEGGVGLGMSIVYNLITQNLKGGVTLFTDCEGFGLRFNC